MGTDRDEQPDPSPGASPAAARSTRWGALAGGVVFAYAVFLAVELSAAGIESKAYGRFHQVQGNAVARVVLAVVLFAIVFHGLNGLRLVLVDLVPRLARHDRQLRIVVQFLTFAVGIPGAFVLLWPSLSEWFG